MEHVIVVSTVLPSHDIRLPKYQCAIQNCAIKKHKACEENGVRDTTFKNFSETFKKRQELNKSDSTVLHMLNSNGCGT